MFCVGQRYVSIKNGIQYNALLGKSFKYILILKLSLEIEYKSPILLELIALPLVLKSVKHSLTPVRVYETSVICLNTNIS